MCVCAIVCVCPCVCVCVCMCVCLCVCVCVCVGLARTMYIQCVYGKLGREITKYAVMYGVYVPFWPTLCVCLCVCVCVCDELVVMKLVLSTYYLLLCQRIS